MFYIAVPLIAFVLSRSNKALLIFTIYCLSIYYSMMMFWLASNEGMEIYLKLEWQIPGQLAFFISGAFLYYFYDKFHKKSLLLFIVSAIILFTHKFIFDVYFLYPAALSVVVVYFAQIFKFMVKFGKYGDFSFGFYIWHFPILQLFIQYELFYNPLIGVMLLALCIFVAAYLSWHLIEKQFLFKSSHYIVSEKS